MVTETEKTSTGKLLPTIDPLHLQQLLVASRALSSTLDLQQVLNVVINTAAELTNSGGSSILLSEPGTEGLRFVATNDPNSPLLNKIVPLEGSLAGWVVQNNESFVSHKLGSETRHFKGNEDISTIPHESIIAVPMRHRGEILGALEVIGKLDEGEYTNHDLAVVQALSSQAAVAISNARLFQQSDAIAEIMHELKTPLMGIMAALDLLERDNLSEENRRHITHSMRMETERLTKMTRDYLELSRLDSGRVLLERAPVNIQMLIESVLMAQTPQATQAELTLESNIAENIPDVIGDFDRLKQVIMNLVSNAIKYNNPGGHVIIHATQEEENVRLSVEDNGRGITAENLKHLFDRFYRVPGSEGYAEGTGLGLVITKKIIDAHKGEIYPESEFGKGTTFHCILPIGTQKT